jgi:hypothetical protein
MRTNKLKLILKLIFIIFQLILAQLNQNNLHILLKLVMILLSILKNK